MSTDRRPFRQGRLLLVLAALLPPLLGWLLSLVPGLVAGPAAALLFVLVVVAVASTGRRTAGLLAAASGALSFDYFLTAPYRTLQILDPADVEVAVGLLLVGVAVTELALWGRRQQARASEQAGYLDAMVEAAQQLRSGSASPEAVLEQIEHQLVGVLELDRAHFEPVPGTDLPRLEPDGRLRDADRLVNVVRDGLPTDTEISLPIRSGQHVLGEFRLIAATHVARPNREQLRVAGLLADQAGLALSYEGN